MIANHNMNQKPTFHLELNDDALKAREELTAIAALRKRLEGKT